MDSRWAVWASGGRAGISLMLLKVRTLDDDIWEKAQSGSTRDLIDDGLIVRRGQRSDFRAIKLCN